MLSGFSSAAVTALEASAGIAHLAYGVAIGVVIRRAAFEPVPGKADSTQAVLALAIFFMTHALFSPLPCKPSRPPLPLVDVFAAAERKLAE